MKKELFNFELPSKYIAQSPVEPRDHSKLLIVDREKKEFIHKYFYDIVEFLNPKDLLIMNDSKVISARLIGEKLGSGAKIEFLLVEDKGNDIWEVLVKPAKRVKTGSKVSFENEMIIATIIDVLENGSRLIKFDYSGDFIDILDKVGKVPIPHYITEELKDKSRYQTVYSEKMGSIAAPTAGLHFTHELLKKIILKGIKIKYITLHVGIGTFRPVTTENILDHKMHCEYYNVSEDTANTINSIKDNGGKIIAVGTTTCRVLESIAKDNMPVSESSGKTDIFIYPPYKFKLVDGLITNFHLPESTLIMLVSAFAGHKFIMEAYKEAISKNYRFYSFGDAMFIKT